MTKTTLALTTTWDRRRKLKSKGGHVCRWIETNCVLGEGDYYGKPVVLEEWQREILWWTYELLPDGTRAYDEVLLGLPKGNGKTPIASWVSMHELACDQCAPVNPVVPVGAASFDQADLLFGDMRITAMESPTLRAVLEPFDTEILLRGKPGRAYRVAAVRSTNDGARPSMFAADELHEWNDPAKEGAWLVLTNGTTKRKNSLRLYVTTAGNDLDSLLGKMYLKGKRIAAQVANNEKVEDPRFLMVWYEAPESWDVSDPEKLRAGLRECNPASFADIEKIAGRFAVIPEFEARRYYGNQWTHSEESWLPAGAWQRCEGEVNLDPALPVYVAVDMALKHDNVAVVCAQPQPNDRIAVHARVWSLEGDSVDVIAVENYLRDLRQTFQTNLKECGYDPFAMHRSAQVLEDEGLPMVEFPQIGERMVPACALAYELIVNGTVLHDGDPTLTDHVLSAAQREAERGWRLSKGRSKRKIDACIALVMALALAYRPPEPPVTPFAQWA